MAGAILPGVSLFRRVTVPDIALDKHAAQDDAALRTTYDAVRGGADWSTARDLLGTTRGDFDRRARYVWVLGESITAEPWATMTSDPDREVTTVDTTAAWPDRWAQAEPDNADAVLVRARSLIARGWEVRGSDWASHVGQDAFAEFHRLLRMAVHLCEQAAVLVPDDPTPWALRLLLDTALGADRGPFEQHWEQVVARDPTHREAHNFKLMYLCRKWRGSHEEMFAFARSTAANAPEGSPLHVLPLMANAEWSLWELEREEGILQHARPVNLTWRKGKEFHAELDNALDRWFRAGPRRHAMWHLDLNYLAYGLFRASRHRDAKAVFEAIGPYAEPIPWGWVQHHDYDADQAFLAARKAAFRAPA